MGCHIKIKNKKRKEISTYRGNLLHVFFKDENAACILIYLICCKARNIQEQLEIHKRHEETALLTNEIAFQKFEKIDPFLWTSQQIHYQRTWNIQGRLTDVRSVISLVN